MRGQIEIQEIGKGRARQSEKQRETEADKEDQQFKTTK